MSTHLILNSDGNRSILQPCEFCNARPGEPCRILYGPCFSQYECPDESCDQTYEKAGEALSCMMHQE